MASHVPAHPSRTTRSLVRSVRPADALVRRADKRRAQARRWDHDRQPRSGEPPKYPRRGKPIATGSGDVRDAPPPDGGTELVDLDRARARAAGVRYCVMVVNSDSGLSFLQLERGFAGLMLRDSLHGLHFDPRTVALRFDLHGDHGVYLPFVLDLEAVPRKVFQALWPERAAKRFVIRGRSDDHIAAIFPAKDLRTRLRRERLRNALHATKARVLRTVIDDELRHRDLRRQFAPRSEIVERVGSHEHGRVSSHER